MLTKHTPIEVVLVPTVDSPLAILLTRCVSAVTFYPLSSAVHRSTHSLIKLLEERRLEFLYPLKLIQKELTSLLQANTNTVGVYKWIKTNVDTSLYSDPEFVAMLTTWCVCMCVCVHVYVRMCVLVVCVSVHAKANTYVCQ